MFVVGIEDALNVWQRIFQLIEYVLLLEKKTNKTKIWLKLYIGIGKS